MLKNILLLIFIINCNSFAIEQINIINNKNCIFSIKKEDNLITKLIDGKCPSIVEIKKNLQSNIIITNDELTNKNDYIAFFDIKKNDINFFDEPIEYKEKLIKLKENLLLIGDKLKENQKIIDNLNLLDNKLKEKISNLEKEYSQLNPKLMKRNDRVDFQKKMDKLEIEKNNKKTLEKEIVKYQNEISKLEKSDEFKKFELNKEKLDYEYTIKYIAIKKEYEEKYLNLPKYTPITYKNNKYFFFKIEELQFKDNNLHVFLLPKNEYNTILYQKQLENLNLIK